jgi:phosphate starvation-inducible membrane PsiE
VKILSNTPFLVFLAFVCYALSVSYSTKVNDACGAQLWKLILAHLLVPLGLLLVIVVGTVTVIICTVVFLKSERATYIWCQQW